jgi:hypothetical protein
MARWISVTATDTNEDTLVNLDNVSAIQGRTIFFVGGDAEDYLVANESHTELTALIAKAERSKA